MPFDELGSPLFATAIIIVMRALICGFAHSRFPQKSDLFILQHFLALCRRFAVCYLRVSSSLSTVNQRTFKAFCTAFSTGTESPPQSGNFKPLERLSEGLRPFLARKFFWEFAEISIIPPQLSAEIWWALMSRPRACPNSPPRAIFLHRAFISASLGLQNRDLCAS